MTDNKQKQAVDNWLLHVWFEKEMVGVNRYWATDESLRKRQGASA